MTYHVCGRPLHVLTPAESALVQEPLVPRYAQSVKVATPSGTALCIESRADLSRLENTYLSDPKSGEVDRYLLIRESHVTCDGLGRRALCTPASFFLCHTPHGAGQPPSHKHTQQLLSLHLPSMTFTVTFDQLATLSRSKRGPAGSDLLLQNDGQTRGCLNWRLQGFAWTAIRHLPHGRGSESEP